MMFNFQVNQHLFYALASGDSAASDQIDEGDEAEAGHRAMGTVFTQP